MENFPYRLEATSTRWLLRDDRDKTIVGEYTYGEFENAQLDRDRLNREHAETQAA